MVQQIDPAPDDHDEDEARLTRRSIRSFVIRNGRTTPAQQDALDRLMPRFGIDLAQHARLDTAFERAAPLWLEVGIGNGDALLAIAGARPDVNLVGIEVHGPGVGHALLGVESAALENVRLVRHDAIEVLQSHCPPASLERLMLFFPDPWHKKRHHKRRIVQADFLDAAALALKPDGLLHCATDIDDYAEWMHERLSAHERFANTAPDGGDVPRPTWRVETRFERRGHRLGHSVHDLVYRRLVE